MSKHFLAALLLISLCSLGPSPGPARAEDAAAPFDGDLQRLAEILGSLHYLRGICGSNDGAKWRNQMQALLDAETPSGDRRTRMIAGFNRGYNGFQQTYRTCTPAATVAIRRYVEEGARISRDLTARYANEGVQGVGWAKARRAHHLPGLRVRVGTLRLPHLRNDEYAVIPG